MLAELKPPHRHKYRMGAEEWLMVGLDMVVEEWWMVDQEVYTTTIITGPCYTGLTIQTRGRKSSSSDKNLKIYDNYFSV
jgi:hypothetical protein